MLVKIVLPVLIKAFSNIDLYDVSRGVN